MPVNRLVIGATLFVVACGGQAKKNQQACEDFVDALSACDNIDTSPYEPPEYCEDWGAYACDVTKYFSDLTTYLNCEGTAVEGTAPVTPTC
jgi:hypothetical protein